MIKPLAGNANWEIASKIDELITEVNKLTKLAKEAVYIDLEKKYPYYISVWKGK